MQEHTSLSFLWERLLTFISAFLDGKKWAIKSTLVSVLLVFIFSTPSYFALTGKMEICDGCCDFQAKINRSDHLLKPDKYPPMWHMAKTEFRLFVPLLAKISGIRTMWGMYLIQTALGVCFFLLLNLLAFRITGDKVVAFFFSLSFSFIYAGKAAFTDVLGFTDSFAFFFLLAAMYYSNPAVIIACLLAAFFTDERAYLAGAAVGIFQWYTNTERRESFKNTGTVLMAYVFSVLIRYYLHINFGLKTPSDAANTVNFSMIGYAFWWGAEGLWLVFMAAMAFLILHKQWLPFIGCLTAMGMVVLAGAGVADVTRSAAYGFTILLPSLLFCNRYSTISECRAITFVSLLVCLTYPGYFFITGKQPEAMMPFFMKAIEKAISLL